VPESVVDGLEIIDVHEQQRQWPHVALAANQLRTRGVLELPSVVEPGEGVDGGERPQLAGTLLGYFIAAAKDMGSIQAEAA
jgi:hypothetical protein